MTNLYYNNTLNGGDTMLETSNVQCNVVYDETYIRKGYIIYQSDYKKFIKIMQDYGNDFIIFSNDEYEDEPDKMMFRPITLKIDETSPLFETSQNLYYGLSGNRLYAKGDLDLGKTNFSLQKDHYHYQITIMKDISYKRNANSNCAIFQVQDTPNGDLSKFYRSLQFITTNEDSREVREKMLCLIPRKRNH